MSAHRYLLWIDAVGGYLVCLSDIVVLGQATPGNRVDVPILGDLSRRHATVRRQGGEYLLAPIHDVKLNGQPLSSPVILTNGAEIELGAGVRLRFRRPHVLSSSARLDFVSHHRTQPSADGILLMADTCVLGPQLQNHVICRDWERDVILFRLPDGLYCRAGEEVEIDGRPCGSRGRLSDRSRVTGADFAMSLECAPT